jgi:hypothetical protein
MACRGPDRVHPPADATEADLIEANRSLGSEAASAHALFALSKPARAKRTGTINLGGIVILNLLVFGIYILSGGSMDIVLHALPAEGGTIGGAAAATVVIGNSIGVLMKIGKDLGAVISGSKWKTADYRDLLCLMSRSPSSPRARA